MKLPRTAIGLWFLLAASGCILGCSAMFGSLADRVVDRAVDRSMALARVHADEVVDARLAQLTSWAERQLGAGLAGGGGARNEWIWAVGGIVGTAAVVLLRRLGVKINGRPGKNGTLKG